MRPALILICVYVLSATGTVASEQDQPTLAQYQITISGDNPQQDLVEAQLPVTDGRIFMYPFGADQLPDGWATFVQNLHVVDLSERPLQLKSVGKATWQGGDNYVGEVQFSDHEIRMLSEQAEREAKEIIARDLFGHYDIVSLKVLKIEGFGASGQDYALAKATLSFSTIRNTALNPPFKLTALEPGQCDSMKVPKWFYLHCGVPVGYVFSGKLGVLLALSQGADRWKAVSPNWRTLRSYPLQGYLLEHEGPVVFPNHVGANKKSHRTPHTSRRK